MPGAIEELVSVSKADVEPTSRLGRDMQWYVYLITIPAAAFLGQVAIELIGRPIATALRLRQKVLERLLAFRDMKLPRPRETAVSSQQIREYDWAAQNVRAAQHTFGDLGTQLLSFSESEPTVRSLLVLCGLDIVQAGHELIILSQLYATAKVGGDTLRRSIEQAQLTAMTALAVSRRPSGDRLMDIRLEPMYLREFAVSRHRKRPLGRPRPVIHPAPLRAKFGTGPTRRFAR